MQKTITAICTAALAAMSFGAAAQPDWRARRDSEIQAQQQYQAPQPGSEHYNPEQDPASPVYRPDNGDYRNDARRQQYEQQYPQRYGQQQFQTQREAEQRDWERRHHARADIPRYATGGYAPEWRGQRYWVRDWRARHLAAPPRGYQWVQTDTGDLLLMALATGLIANVVVSR